jgi:phosphate transporter
MDPPLDWLQWFAVALPVATISVVLIWLLLLVAYRPARLPPGAEEAGAGNADGELEIKPIKASRDSFSRRQWFVAAVCLVTIGLWCVEHEIESWVGDMGVIALIPVVVFFATGVLKKVRMAALLAVLDS